MCTVESSLFNPSGISGCGAMITRNSRWAPRSGAQKQFMLKFSLCSGVLVDVICVDSGGVNWVEEWEQRGFGCWVVFFFEIFARDGGGGGRVGGADGVLGFLGVVPVV